MTEFANCHLFVVIMCMIGVITIIAGIGYWSLVWLFLIYDTKESLAQAWDQIHKLNARVKKGKK